MTWHPIETAPKDGRILHVKREVGGEILFEGEACWRTVDMALHDHLIGLAVIKATDWFPPNEHYFLRPTHWREDQ